MRTSPLAPPCLPSRLSLLQRGIDLKKVAEQMTGSSGAELKAVCTEAGMFALRERRVHVTQVRGRPSPRARAGPPPPAPLRLVPASTRCRHACLTLHLQAGLHGRVAPAQAAACLSMRAPPPNCVLRLDPPCGCAPWLVMCRVTPGARHRHSQQVHFLLGAAPAGGL